MDTVDNDNTGESILTLDLLNEIAADMVDSIRRLWPTAETTTDVAEEPTQQQPPTEQANLSTVLANLWPAGKVTNADIMAKLNEVTARLDKLEAKPSSSSPSQTTPPPPPGSISNEDLALMIMDKFAKQDRKMELLAQKVNDMQRDMNNKFTKLTERVEEAEEFLFVECAAELEDRLEEGMVELDDRLNRDKAAVFDCIARSEHALYGRFVEHMDKLHARLDDDKRKGQQLRAEWGGYTANRLNQIDDGCKRGFDGVMELVDARYAGMKGYVRERLDESEEKMGEVLEMVMTSLRVQNDWFEDVVDQIEELRDEVDGVMVEVKGRGGEMPEVSSSPAIASRGNDWGESDESCSHCMRGCEVIDEQEQEDEQEDEQKWEDETACDGSSDGSGDLIEQDSSDDDW
ncbi:hypothetical protein QBC40DRAFT_279537 [Triangularia verruculosa]|uniref:Uncharacterized protein n=1 Tax=Triangularia verruculosa TaxID=2587418 RepID=A0AAN7AVA8_9PEZI|nr:hypothetical protein QBC40DRAFT_279537 [Triangularia verruculosa]